MELKLDKNKKYLLAVSGGIDSMVMCHIFLKNNFVFAVAHCNFMLRETDSDLDELLVRNWCEKNNISCFVKKIDTKKYIEENKLSIQVGARKIRYDFFEDIILTEKIHHIVSAHHADDNIETMLFHLSRGSGINGLRGIPSANKHIIRPLLAMSKKEIIEYAKGNEIQFREDSSNAKTDYTRNKIRHEMIPQMEEIFPDLRKNILHSIENLQDAYEIYSQQIETYRKKLVEKRGQDFYIAIRKLIHVRPLNTVIYELLKPFGFSFEQSLSALKLIDSESGSFLENEKYRFIKDRNFFIITEKNTEASDLILIEKNTKKVSTNSFDLKINVLAKEKFHLQKEETIAQLNADELQFPFILRRWKTGDYMYPLGMKKKKKISRILIDAKIPLHEKENIWVVESDKKIIWIVGIKIDERYKVRDVSKSVLEMRVQKK